MTALPHTGLILELCSGSGSWSEPYKRAGYPVQRITLPEDVRLATFPEMPVRGILAGPPCTVFASSGARWKRTEEEMLQALSVVDACLRFVAVCKPNWWALENPVGTLRRWLGPPRWKFNPSDYGDPYTKKTLLWGDFRVPQPSPVEATLGSVMHRLGPSPDRAARRAVTPEGFARAFILANP